jgi:ATP-dependent RNA helicase DeaD
VREKLKQLKWLLETEETDGVIVFVKTRQTTNVVAESLAQDGLNAAALNGDIAQNQRERTVNRLKSGKIDIVVATDVAARGLDVKRISHVVNYDFPHDSEIYVHRIGRTGRAGRSGKAILFVEPKEKRKLGWLEKDTKQKIGLYKPKSLKEVNQVRVDKFRDEILKNTAHEQVKFFRTLVESIVEKTEHSVETIAAALAVMAQGSSPLLLSDEQGSRKGRNGKVSHSDQDKASYRIEVGRNHGVGPGNIVGAIANEGGFQNREIGRVKLFDSFSIVDLPADISSDVLDILRNVSVGGSRLQITKTTEKYDDRDTPRRSGRRSNNGSTNFVKRQRGERSRDNRGKGGYDRGKPSGGSPGYRGRQSISSSDTFAESPKRRPSRSERPDQGSNKSSSSPMRSKAATANRSTAESSPKPAPGGRGGSKPKPARKYIKVRNRK